MPRNVEGIRKYIYYENLKELYVFKSALLNFCEAIFIKDENKSPYNGRVTDLLLNSNRFITQFYLSARLCYILVSPININYGNGIFFS